MTVTTLEQITIDTLEWIDQAAGTIQHLQEIDSRGELTLDERCTLFKTLRSVEYYFEGAPETH